MRRAAEAPAARIRAVDPDAELVARAQANPREFLGLYDRYFDRVLGYARLRVADAATCEDVTSRVFTTALEQLGRFRGEDSFAGWFGYADTNDYRPRYMDDPQRDGSVVRLRVVAYEYLPMTASNRAFLSVTAQHPTARIVAGSNNGSGK